MRVVYNSGESAEGDERTVFPGFETADFALFELLGFGERMTALRTQLSPKFALLGAELKDELSILVGDEVFPHVARHARRKTHPPNDSWVAFGGKRGYKMLPHFQVCVWSTHVLIQWGLIYEAKQKGQFATNLRADRDKVKRQIPADFQWSKDHMMPFGTAHGAMTDDDFADIAQRLQHNKNGEVMVGKVVPKEQALALSGTAFHTLALDVWRQLLPLHRMAGAGTINRTAVSQ